MRFALALTAAIATLGSQNQPQESEVPTEPRDAPTETVDSAPAPQPDASGGPDELGPPNACDPSRVRTSVELGRAFEELVRRHPDLVTLQHMATSEYGRPVRVVTLTDRRSGSPSAKPGLLVVAGLHDLAGHEADVLLAALCRVAEAATVDPEVAELLREITLFAVPDIDPDARARRIGESTSAPSSLVGRVAIDRNFPAGWDPWLGGEVAGPYPLVRNEARALARFVMRQTNVSVVQVLWTAPTDELLGTMAVYGRENARGGSLLEFVRRDLGAFGFSLATFAPESNTGDAVRRRDHEVSLAVAGILDLSRRLPRVRLEVVSSQRLQVDLWQIDLAVRNVGRLPAQGPPGPHRGVGPLALRAEGAIVLAAAERRAPDESFVVYRGDPHEVFLDRLEGGGVATVRLVVQADEPGDLTVFLSSARAGQAKVDVPLR